MYMFHYKIVPMAMAMQPVSSLGFTAGVDSASSVADPEGFLGFPLKPLAAGRS